MNKAENEVSTMPTVSTMIYLTARFQRDTRAVLSKLKKQREHSRNVFIGTPEAKQNSIRLVNMQPL